MENDTYFTHIQKSNGRKENAYMDLFTVSNSRTSLRSCVDESEYGAGGESDNLYSVIGQPRGCRRRSKIIIAVLIVVVIAVVVSIAVTITAAGKNKSGDSSDEPSDMQPVKGSSSTTPSGQTTLPSPSDRTTTSTTETTTILTSQGTTTASDTQTTKEPVPSTPAAKYVGPPSCLTSTCIDCRNRGKLTLNRRTGNVDGALNDATVDSLPVRDDDSVDCNYRARVKVTFEPETAINCTILLKIDMEFGTKRSTHLFNLGDSETSDGFAGDAGTQSNDAEIHGVNGNVNAYQSGQGDCSSAKIEEKAGVLGPTTTEATIWLAHRYYRIKNGTLDHELCDECLFDLDDGSDDEGPVNRDLFLSFNRVNSGRGDRNGYGICSVKLSWICNVA